MKDAGGRMESKLFSIQQAGFTISIALQIIGQDVLATITGGDTPHIGTVTTYTMEEKKVTRFPSHDGRFHKDDVLADIFVKAVAKTVPHYLVVTSGVHVDHISKAQIAASFPMVESLSREIVQWLETVNWGEEAVYYKNGEKPQ